MKSLTDLALEAAPDDPCGALLYAVKMKRLRMIESGELVAAADEVIPIRLTDDANVELSA